jgi:hypothetical protein
MASFLVLILTLKLRAYYWYQGIKSQWQNRAIFVEAGGNMWLTGEDSKPEAERQDRFFAVKTDLALKEVYERSRKP